MKIIVSGISTHYQQLGDDTKPVVLFIHGWGGSHQSLYQLALNLQDWYRCILIDLPGFGHTANPPPTWGVPEYSTYICDFLSCLNLAKVTVVGHSFGGAIALNLASNFSQHVSQIIVFAPSWHRKNVINPLNKSRLRSVPLLRKIIYRLFYPNSDLLKYPQLEDNFKRIMSQDLTETVQNIKLPTLIMWGDNDTYVPYSDGQLLHQYIALSAIKIFPDIGHNLPIKYWQLTIASIRSFLTTNNI